MTKSPVEVAGGQLRVTLLVANEVTRRGLGAMLSGLTPVHSVNSCPRVAGLASLLSPGEAHIVLATMPEARALRAAGDEAGRHAKVVVLVDEVQMADFASLTSLAPDGILVYQDLTAESLDEAIRRIVAGELPMPASVTRRLLARAGGAPGQRAAAGTLTPREMATLTLLAEGLSNKQIAKRLRISEHGAKRLVTSVLLKLGSPNRTTAVVTAIRVGLIDYA